MIRHRNIVLWGGGVVLALTAAWPAHADEKSDALLKEVETATQSAKTLTANLSTSQSFAVSDSKDEKMTMVATLKLKKPNMARIEFTEGGAAKTIVSDGKNVYTLMPGNQYQKKAADAQGKNIDTFWAAPVSMFFSGQFSSYYSHDKPTTAYMGKQTVDGIEYDVVQVSGAKPFAYTGKLYIAPSKLVTRLDMEIKQYKQTMKLDAILKNVKLNAPLPNAVFAYTLPKGMTLYVDPVVEDLRKKLLLLGSVAPAFALSAPTGGKVELAAVLKGKKAVLVNFWYFG